jgi:parallel beta-helix repeat protein
VDGTNTNVNVTANTVTGLLTTGIIGQNGIQISRGAKGTVDGNTVSGFTYGSTISLLSATGILVYDETGGVTITNNHVTGNDEGIGVYTDAAYDSSSNPVQVATTAVIKNNQVNGNVYLGIHIDPFATGNTIWNNTVTGNVGGWDELDEHPDFNSNNWGTDPSNFNTIGNAHAGLVFSY